MKQTPALHIFDVRQSPTKGAVKHRELPREKDCFNLD